VPSDPTHFKLKDVDSESSFAFSQFMEQNAGKKEVFVDIDSPGGSVGSGLEIIKLMEAFPGDVICTVDGMAASMGAAILGSCDWRIMTKRSLLMFHEPAMMSHGKPVQIQQDVDLLKALSVVLIEQYTLKSKMTAEELQLKIANGYEWWAPWTEALANGFVDEVVKK
jgi:ATP-dependent Clp protease protease subunit